MSARAVFRPMTADEVRAAKALWRLCWTYRRSMPEAIVELAVSMGGKDLAEAQRRRARMERVARQLEATIKPLAVLPPLPCSPGPLFGGGCSHGQVYG